MRHRLSERAAARGSKRHNGFPRKVVAFEKCIDDVRRSEPPEREPDEDGLIRREIGKRIRLRFTPEISFALDTSLNYSDHIQRLLNEIHEEQPNGKKEDV